MPKAIYLKQEEEGCGCMTPIQDGTECEIEPCRFDARALGFLARVSNGGVTNSKDFVSVTGCKKGCDGCTVFYRSKNFVQMGEQDETEMERNYELNKQTV